MPKCVSSTCRCTDVEVGRTVRCSAESAAGPRWIVVDVLKAGSAAALRSPAKIECMNAKERLPHPNLHNNRKLDSAVWNEQQSMTINDPG